MDQVYVLNLEGGKWYVGKSKQVSKRIRKHVIGNATQWTGIHKIKAVYGVFDGSDHLENLITIKLMANHGIDNVRGGNWAQPHLSDRRLRIATRHIIDFNSHSLRPPPAPCALRHQARYAHVAPCTPATWRSWSHPTDRDHPISLKDILRPLVHGFSEPFCDLLGSWSVKGSASTDPREFHSGFTEPWGELPL